MSLLGWAKPEYLLQPRRLLRRLTAGSPNPHSVEVMLPWGLPILVQPGDFIGVALHRLGIYDLAVSETLWRLTDAGDTVVDVGANIGYTTAILAVRLKGRGEIFCFEPHPETFRRLTQNVARWRRLLPQVEFECFQTALSDASGEAILVQPWDFERDSGGAKLESGFPGDGRESFKVVAAQLDDVLPASKAIHLLKLDVEGHEARVLRGAQQILKDGRARDVLFEELGEYPSAASRLLEGYGYHVRRVRKAFFGPELIPPDATTDRSTWEPTNFLATRDVDRARERLSARGWSILRGKSSSASSAGDPV